MRTRFSKTLTTLGLSAALIGGSVATAAPASAIGEGYGEWVCGAPVFRGSQPGLRDLQVTSCLRSDSTVRKNRTMNYKLLFRNLGGRTVPIEFVTHRKEKWSSANVWTTFSYGSPHTITGGLPANKTVEFVDTYTGIPQNKCYQGVIKFRPTNFSTLWSTWAEKSTCANKTEVD